MNGPILTTGEQNSSQPKNRQGMVYSALLVTLLVLFLGLALWAGQWGLAGIHTYPARFVLENWEKDTHTYGQSGQAPEEAAWFAALEALAKARLLAPGDANSLIILGRMHHHNALTQIPWSDNAKFHRQQAIASYQQALQLQPAWGYAWILLAQVIVQSGESTKVAIAALMRAISLAPWSGDVQKTGVQLGFALWPLLHEAQRTSIRTLAKNAFPLYGDVILQQAVKHKQLKLIQPLLENSPQCQTTLDKLLTVR